MSVYDYATSCSACSSTGTGMQIAENVTSRISSLVRNPVNLSEDAARETAMAVGNVISDGLKSEKIPDDVLRGDIQSSLMTSLEIPMEVAADGANLIMRLGTETIAFPGRVMMDLVGRMRM